MEERQNREKEHLDLQTFAVNMAHHFEYDKRLLSEGLQGFEGFTECSALMPSVSWHTTFRFVKISSSLR